MCIFNILQVASGSLEVLKNYPVDFRVRTTPLKPCKTRGRKPKDGFSPRKLAVQNAFKQLIASGKLHRIEPPISPLKNNLISKCGLKYTNYHHNNILPDSSMGCEPTKCENYHQWSFIDKSEELHKSEKTACNSYPGKNMLEPQNNPLNNSNINDNCNSNCHMSNHVHNQNSFTSSFDNSPG